MGIFHDIDNNLTSDNPYYGQEQSLGEALKAEFSFNYEECKDLYSYWSLGKRLVESIIDFSLSVERDILIQDAPDEVAERFKKVEKELRITQLIKNFLAITRTYGTAGLLVTSKKPNDDYKNLDINDYKFDFGFNVLDPYNFRVQISQDPLDFDFLKPSYIFVKGRLIGKNRGLVMFNGSPLYIQYNESSLSFGGRSIFSNMGRLIRTWDTLLSSLEAIAVKAGGIVIENSQESMTDPTSFEVARVSATLFKQLRAGRTAMLNAGQTAQFFALNGATEISSMITEVKEALAMALNDTPTAVLLDKDLSNGLSNGSEDMRNVIIKVNTFRELYLKPVYEFIDKHLFFKAWDDDFINSMRSKGDYDGLSNHQIRQKWMSDFEFKWQSIYPKTPDEESKAKSDDVDTLIKLKDLGANSVDLETALENLKIFGNKISLNPTDAITPAFIEEDI